MWDEVLARFEKQAPASVMARLALEQAMPAVWIDEVFEANRQRQYPRELLFSTVVELMSLVCLGLRLPTRKMEHLPVTLAALYDKIKRMSCHCFAHWFKAAASVCSPSLLSWGARPVFRGGDCV